MKKTLRKRIALVLASVMAVSSFSVQAGAAAPAPAAVAADHVILTVDTENGGFREAGDDATTAKFLGIGTTAPWEVGTSTTQGDDAVQGDPEAATGIEVWAGGGKATLTNGATVDGKMAQLYVQSKDGGKWYDVTTAKSTIWGASTESKPADQTNGAKFDPTAGKFTDDTAKNNIKVGKGKVVAGKVPTESSAPAYVHVVADYDKKKANASENPNSGTALTPVKVDVKAAATVLQFVPDQGTNGTDAWNGKAFTDSNTMPANTAIVKKENLLKSVVVPVDANGTNVFMQALAKIGSELGFADAENTFKIEVDKGAPLLVATANSGAAAASISSASYADIAVGTGIKITYDETGVEDSKKFSGKIIKASITVTCIQSGKKAKLGVSIGNPVLEQKDYAGTGGLDGTTATTGFLADKKAAGGIVGTDDENNAKAIFKDVTLTDQPEKGTVLFRTTGAKDDGAKVKVNLADYVSLASDSAPTTDALKVYLRADEPVTKANELSTFVENNRIKNSAFTKVSDKISAKLTTKPGTSNVAGEVEIELNPTYNSIDDAEAAADLAGKIKKYTLVCVYNLTPGTDDVNGIVQIPILVCGSTKPDTEDE